MRDVAFFTALTQPNATCLEVKSARKILDTKIHPNGVSENASTSIDSDGRQVLPLMLDFAIVNDTNPDSFPKNFNDFDAMVGDGDSLDAVNPIITVVHAWMDGRMGGWM